ncbi:MAG: hypothetical protein V3U41_02575 [candidate division NC10 bacterium]
MQEALLAFVALFVAVDILGVLPVYLGLTMDVPSAERARLPWQATLTATGVGVGGEPLPRGVRGEPGAARVSRVLHPVTA